jgi:SPP1 gp7 family putative phage head morphogenesis protein
MASANEELADRARVHAINLLRFDAKVRRDVLRQLERLEKDLIERLRLGAIAGDEPGAAALTPAQRQRLTTLLTGVTETIRTAYRGIDTGTAGELAGLAVSEGEWTVRSLAGALGTDAVAVMPASATLRSVAGDALVQGAPSREWWSRQAGDLVERFSDEVRQGIIAGETNSQIVRRIRGSRAAGYKDGLMEVTRRNAEALVRTSVQSVANDALMTTARENADVVKGFEQISTLDSRTTTICIAYSGKTWDLDGNPIGHDLPFNGGTPRHWGCRSVTVPLLKSWTEMGVNIRDEIPPSTRASLDGQVPEDMTFDKFLSGKSKTFQDDLLGPGRAELWREGKITLTQLVDQRGRPLTLDQLRAAA